MAINAKKYAPKRAHIASAEMVVTQRGQRVNYSSAVNADMAVCVVFFSPAGWKKPIDHLYTVCNDLLRARCPIFVLELVKPGKQSYVSNMPGMSPTDKAFLTCHVIESSSTLFAKENLQNLLARRVPQKYQKLCFMDADVYFDTPDWYQQCSRALDQFDIVQPFEFAQWLNKENQTNTTPTKIAAAKALALHATPALDATHPGFAWAFKRKTFQAISGYYELHLAGGGDIAFAAALMTQPLQNLMPPMLSADFAPMRTPSWQQYADNIKTVAPSVNYLPNIGAVHMYHGSSADRKYVTRCNFLPPVAENGEYPVIRRADGLLEWVNPGYDKQLEQYFISRQEDM